MLFLDIFEYPIEFIRENLTGWVILIIVVLIIYFICLRNYYKKQEQFFDQARSISDIQEIEEIENNITQEIQDDITNTRKKPTTYKNYNKNISENMKKYKKEYKQERAFIKNSNRVNNDFDQLDNDTNKSIDRYKSKKNKTLSRNTNSKKGKNIIEGFAEISLDQTQDQANKIDNLQTISTTLFDNLGLNDLQILSCKAHYNDILAQIIIDIGQLYNSYSKNRYLNVKKQFDSILAKSIDSISNYLANPIKSPRVVTRTAIRTDIMNTLNSVLENLINQTNMEITNEMNKLAMMNSTTIDYNTQLNGITERRNKLAKYIGIDKLLNDLGYNISLSNKTIDSILDKSFILPIYERNFDKINQLVKSDFNDNETELTAKYGKAYTDFLEQQKKEELNINPLSLASKIESSIVSFLSGYKNKSDINKSNYDKSASTDTEIREQLTRDYGYTNNTISYSKSNPIPDQQTDLVKDTELNPSNIYIDPSSRGSYMINKKTQKSILEGFENTSNTQSNTTISNSTNPNLLKALDNTKSNSSKSSNNKDILSNLLSGDFLQYMLGKINDYMSNGYNAYSEKMNTYLGDMTGFKIEDNMIPAGFLLFILSMLLYFVDVTS
jgi:hypothetical protein